MKKLTSVAIGLLAILSVQPTIAQHSLYQDVKASQVGDIITVVLMENISGSSESDSKSTSKAGGGASGSTTGNFLPFEPTFGSDVSVNYDSDQVNLASQRQLLEGFMSVQIVEVTPRGDLIVAGSRETEINGDLHRMALKGTVRPNDVSSQNKVFSYRVANASISYQKEEGLNKLTNQKGLLKRMLLTGVGAALGATIVIKALE